MTVKPKIVVWTLLMLLLFGGTIAYAELDPEFYPIYVTFDNQEFNLKINSNEFIDNTSGIRTIRIFFTPIGNDLQQIRLHEVRAYADEDGKGPNLLSKAPVIGGPIVSGYNMNMLTDGVGFPPDMKPAPDKTGIGWGNKWYEGSGRGVAYITLAEPVEINRIEMEMGYTNKGLRTEAMAVFEISVSQKAFTIDELREKANQVIANKDYMGALVPEAGSERMEGVKTRRTYFTEERLAQIKPGLAGSVSRANQHVALGYEYLWNLVTTQNLPRSSRVSDASTSWTAVPGQLWKITDGKYVYPTNDFEAYYKSGLDDHGMFQPNKADKSLLVNTLYPEKGPKWGVDDGWGWTDEQGVRHTFVAYYNHHHIWYRVRDILKDLRNAYLYTNDVKYARAGIVLLDRVADIYPSLDLSAFDKSIFANSHAGTGKGKAIGRIWETGLITSFVTDYDAFFPALLQEDEEITGFLSKKAEQYNLGDLKCTTAGIRKEIEDNILCQVLPGVKKGQIVGNFGMHQNSLAMSAVVMDEPVGYTAKAIQYLFKSGENGDVMRVLVDVIDRDGHGNESSPSYNGIHRRTIADVADALMGYDGYSGADLSQHLKFAKMMTAGNPLGMLDKYIPVIGDCGLGGKPDDPNVSIQGSVNLAGYGFTALRDGARITGADTRRALWMYYGRNAEAHAHRDSLNIGLYAFGLDLSPDLGYPEFARAGWPSRVNWTSTTLSHNTVVVNHQRQEDQWVGLPQHYDDSSIVKLIDVEAPKVYSATSLYKRTTAMVRVDEVNSYVIDFIRVKGGNEHYFSFHGNEGAPATVTGLNLIEQAKGTLAGENVPFAAESADNQNGFNYLENVARDLAPANQFSVDWAINDNWHVLRGTQDIHLRLTMLTDVDEVDLADGKNPRDWSLTYRYLLARRSGQNLNSCFTSVIEPYKDARFIESIERVAVTVNGEVAAESDVQAVKVVLANGRTDYIVSALSTETEYIIDNRLKFQGFFGVYSEQQGQPVYAYVNDGVAIGLLDEPIVNASIGHLTGTVVDFTRDMSFTNHIIVRLDNVQALPQDLAGRSIVVKNDGERSGWYLIEGAQLEGDLLTLDIGDITLIRAWEDAQDFGKGFVYDIAPGAAFRIPLTWTFKIIE